MQFINLSFFLCVFVRNIGEKSLQEIKHER